MARKKIHSPETTETLVSSISIWEIGKLVQKRRIDLKEPIQKWVQMILDHPQISIIDLNSEISIEACNLPGNFHSDPVNQIIVATARIHHATILTKDQKILDYPHVKSEW